MIRVSEAVLPAQVKWRRDRRGPSSHNREERLAQRPTDPATRCPPEVPPIRLNTPDQAVKRNPDRFPADFMFQLTAEEAEFLRSQSVILESDARSVAASKRRIGRGRHAKYLPNAFAEQGVAMLSSVLRSNRAVLVNIEIMRAFVRLRGILSSNADLARKLAVLEAKYDKQFKVVFDAIGQLMTPPPRVSPPQHQDGARAPANLRNSVPKVR
jgi:hypothetical protein